MNKQEAEAKSLIEKELQNETIDWSNIFLHAASVVKKENEELEEDADYWTCLTKEWESEGTQRSVAVFRNTKTGDYAFLFQKGDLKTNFRISAEATQYFTEGMIRSLGEIPNELISPCVCGSKRLLAVTSPPTRRSCRTYRRGMYGLFKKRRGSAGS